MIRFHLGKNLPWVKGDNFKQNFNEANPLEDSGIHPRLNILEMQILIFNGHSSSHSLCLNVLSTLIVNA